jgi:hypothetical protein
MFMAIASRLKLCSRISPASYSAFAQTGLPTGSAEYLFAVSTNEIKVGGVRERSINMIGQSHTSHKITAQIASR